jgi:hypothetical protein
MRSGTIRLATPRSDNIQSDQSHASHPSTSNQLALKPRGSEPKLLLGYDEDT